MTIVSQALAELINLRNLAVYHREHCADDSCGVALFTLGKTAERLLDFVWHKEREEATRLISEIPTL